MTGAEIVCRARPSLGRYIPVFWQAGYFGLPLWKAYMTTSTPTMSLTIVVGCGKRLSPGPDLENFCISGRCKHGRWNSWGPRSEARTETLLEEEFWSLFYKARLLTHFSMATTPERSRLRSTMAPQVEVSIGEDPKRRFMAGAYVKATWSASIRPAPTQVQEFEKRPTETTERVRERQLKR